MGIHSPGEEPPLTDTGSPTILSSQELRRICLDAGADDAGFIQPDREAVSGDRDSIMNIFPETQTVVSIVKACNSDSIRSASLSVVDWEFTKTHSDVSDAAGRIIRTLNHKGIRGVSVPPGFPMDMNRWPGKIWEASHKTIAVEAGRGRMGLNRIVIHPEFGNHIILDTLLISSRLDQYDAPLEKDPCIECRLCVAVCPVGAISKDGEFDFLSCAMHNYHELFGGFQEWIEELAAARSIHAYRSRFRDRETAAKWQALTYGHAYRCSYCMAVCPAGAMQLRHYQPDKRRYVERYLKPLKSKEEPVYVIRGTRAEKTALNNDKKDVRHVRNTIRPSSISTFLDGVKLLFSPEHAGDLKATLHFSFTGKENRNATVSISDQTVKVMEGHAGNADVRVTADSESWIRMLHEEVSLPRLLLMRKLKLKGNLLFLRKFKECIL